MKPFVAEGNASDAVNRKLFSNQYIPKKGSDDINSLRYSLVSRTIAKINGKLDAKVK